MDKTIEKIKSKINTHKSEVDPEKIWMGIQKKRKKRDKNPLFIWYWTGAAVLLTGIAFTLWYLRVPDNKPVSDTKKIVLNEKLPLSENQYNNQNLSTSKIDYDNKEKNKYTVNTNKSKIDINKNKNLKPTKSIKLIPNEQIIFENKTPLNFSKKIIDSINVFNSTNQTYTVNNDYNTQTAICQNSKSTSTKNNFIKNFEDRNVDNLDYLLSLKLMDYPEISLSNNPPEIHNFEFKKRNKNINNSSLQLSGGGFYTFSNFKNLTPESSQLISLAQNSEKYLEAFNLSCLYRIDFNSNLSFKTGIGFNQSDSKLEYSHIEKENQLSQNVLEKVIINSFADTVKYYSLANVVHQYNVTEKVYNYRSQIYIPLYLGYNFDISKYNFFIMAGTSFKVIEFNKGKLLTPLLKTLSLNEAKNDYLTYYVIDNLYLGIDIKKRITRKISLIVNPNINIYLRSKTKDILTYRLYNKDIGLNLGINYDFGE